jgi:hypothetical protein
MTSERYRRGWEKLREIDEDAGERLIDSLFPAVLNGIEAANAVFCERDQAAGAGSND